MMVTDRTLIVVPTYNERENAGPLITKLLQVAPDADVLIVDDNAANRSILNHQTSSWGMIATEAESGEQALELLRAGARDGQPYAVAILDLMMPKMNGLEVLRKLKLDPKTKKIPVIMLTNMGKDKDIETALSLGAIKYITKIDHTPKEVVSQVEEIIQAATRDKIPDMS